jgi:Domain of unknown function (DUF4430)
MITINITNRPTLTANWTSGMNVQQALEQAFYNAPPGTFTYALQYFGSYGYLVLMINDTFESFNSKQYPFFFWEFILNGQIAQQGIDQTILNNGDVVTFEFTSYNPNSNPTSTTHMKYQQKIQ